MAFAFNLSHDRPISLLRDLEAPDDTPSTVYTLGRALSYRLPAYRFDVKHLGLRQQYVMMVNHDSVEPQVYRIQDTHINRMCIRI